METTLSTPAVNVRPASTYMGIREQIHMDTLDATMERMRQELQTWFSANNITPTDAPLLRYYVIDGECNMDIELGFPVASALAGTDTIRPVELPAGRYASLVFQGDGLIGNKTLLDWVAEQNLTIDGWDDPAGDGFAGRFERFLTDPAVEPRIEHWDIEFALKLAD